MTACAHLKGWSERGVLLERILLMLACALPPQAADFQGRHYMHKFSLPDRRRGRDGNRGGTRDACSTSGRRVAGLEAHATGSGRSGLVLARALVLELAFGVESQADAVDTVARIGRSVVAAGGARGHASGSVRRRREVRGGAEWGLEAREDGERLGRHAAASLEDEQRQQRRTPRP